MFGTIAIQRTFFMDSESDPLIGQLVSGRYRVIKPLGAGGMGQVYLAEHEAIEKKIALKVLHLEFSRKEEIVTRFRQEAISASRIKHPNVLDVFDFGQLEDGSFYLAMEFLEGCDLADDLKSRQKLDPARALAFAMQICRALAAAHKNGVVHRDMKPENIFLQRTADGEEIVKIVDFGIAQLRSQDEAAQAEQPKKRLTKTGMIFGTPEYMAPEQAAGKQIDLRVDVYAVGVILYELFTGAVPFTGDSFLEVLNKHLTAPPPPMTTYVPELALSSEMQAAVLKALAKDPADRYTSMNEFAQALISTPEGAAFSGSRMSSLPEISPSQFVPAAGVPTAAQFAGQPQNPAATQQSAGDQGTAVTQMVDAATASALASMPPPGTVGAVTASNTQLAATTTTAGVQKRSSAGAAIAGVLGLAVVAGIGVFGFTQLQSAESPKAEPEPKEQAATEPAAEPTASMAPAAPSADVAPITEVTLRVETDPSGAILTKGGFQVCSETPCDVKTSPNESLELEASKGKHTGVVKVLAERDQTVKIKLKAPKPKVKPRTAKQAPPSTAPAAPAQRMCEVEVGGLKILRACP